MSTVDFLNGIDALVDRCMANAKSQRCSCGERKHPEDQYCVHCQAAGENDGRMWRDERGYGQ